jgi:hypothetical protein
LLEEGGYFGNVTTLRLVYQTNIDEFHKIIYDKLEDTKIACFSTSPDQVFPEAEVRVAIMTSRKGTDEGSIRTSELIRFDATDRTKKFENIQYQDVDNLILGEKIGSESGSLPKIGKPIINDILNKLKDNFPRTIGEASSREKETEHVVWRDYHPRYWMNPYLENLYGDSKSRDFEPMYFESELERRFSHIVLQSSLFYLYWTVYDNERDLNWGRVDAFPLPKKSDLEDYEEEIHEYSEDLWEIMKSEFNGERIENPRMCRRVVDKIDVIIGELYGLSEEETEFLTNYHTEFDKGRSGPDDADLSEFE